LKSSSKVQNQVSFAQPVQPYLHLVPSLSPLFPLAESWCQLTSQIVDISVGPELLRHIVDTLGNPIDRKGPINATEHCHASLKAPGILSHGSAHGGWHKTHQHHGSHWLWLTQVDHWRTSDCQTAVAIDTILNQERWNNGKVVLCLCPHWSDTI